MSLRVGVAGVGVMGAHHARNLATAISGAQLTAIADANAERAAAFAQEYKGTKVHADPRSLIDDRGIDAVVIATPEETHAELVLACLKAGKPVLCEKPLAANVDACLKVVAAEVALGRRLVQIGFMRRFDPGYQTMKKAIVDKRYGAPLLFHCAHRNAHAAAFLSRDEMLIRSAAVHEIDISRWLFNDEMARATVLAPPPSGKDGLRDPQMLVLQTVRGVVIDVEIFLNAQFGSEVNAELVCSSGTVSLAAPVDAVLRHEGHNGPVVPQQWMPRFETAYLVELQAWVRSVERGEPSREAASAWDGYAASATADFCVASLTGGSPVTITLEKRPEFYA
jgi:myo-inositol 2-dehydrogenase/D-chiro-inositol 1-dehydrogenase